jgi:hypothetical protein
MVGKERQVFSETVSETDHLGNDLNGHVHADVGDIRGDIVDVRPRDDARVDLCHASCIHVNNDGKEIGGPWTPRGQTGRGAPLFPNGTRQEHGTGLPIGREHRPQQGGRDIDPLADRVQEVKDEVVVAFGPIKGKPAGGVVSSDRGCHPQREVVGKCVCRPGAAGWGDTSSLQEKLERRPPRFSPKPVEHAEEDDRTVVVDLA